MKKFILLGASLVILVSCIHKSEHQAKKSGVEIWFEKSTYDYGEIEENSDGIYPIKFKNIGKEAIVVNNVRTSCGCTVPSWPRNPVEPGDTGIIKVKYNTALPGSFMKSVTVYSTAANSPVKLIIKGKVLPKKEK